MDTPVLFCGVNETAQSVLNTHRPDCGIYNVCVCNNYQFRYGRKINF